MVDAKFIQVIWCYGVYQPLYDEILAVGKCPVPIVFHEGLPDLDKLNPNEGPRMIILDDMMSSVNGRVVDLFTKTSHHRNISAFFLTQNLFHQGKGARDMSLNSHYLVCFKNPRDRAQIMHLSRQVWPENPKALQEAYTEATGEPHNYLLLDFKQGTPDEFRVRAKIFPDDEHNFVYVLNKKAGK